ncbi:MAG: lysophospholipid acyltransferase family protein [Erysipelotrichaceae bacterium]
MQKAIFFLKAAWFFPYYYIQGKRMLRKPYETRYAMAKQLSKRILSLAGARVRVSYQSPLDTTQTYLFVGNHQGSLDPFIVLHTMPVAVSAVAKQELKTTFFIQDWFANLEGIGFDRSSLKDGMRMIKELARTLEQGRSMVIFPEGTRSNSNQVLEFKAGALKAAYMAKATIVPFALVNAHTLLDQGPKQPVTVRFLEPIPYASYETMTTAALSKQLETSIQTEVTRALEV